MSERWHETVTKRFKDTYLPEPPNIAGYPSRDSSVYLVLVFLGDFLG